MRIRPLRSTPDAPLTPVAEPPAAMRAVVVDAPGGPDALRAASVPVPSPVLSELLVRVVAAGVNPIDAKTRAGAGVSGAIDAYPATPGFDFSGIVVKSPYESHPLPPGTEVFGMASFPRTGGSYAEYVVAPSLSVARKPAALSHVEAAGVPLAALTAWGLVVETAHAHEGQRVLIHAGGGGVGHFAVQFAAYFGAHVTVTASARNAPWLRELGASVVIDYTTTRFEEVVGEVDVVIDLVGNVGGDTGTRSLGVLRPGGLYVARADRLVAGLRRGRGRGGRACHVVQGHPRRRRARDHRPAARLGLGAGVHRERLRARRGARGAPRDRDRPHPRQGRPPRQRRLTRVARLGVIA